MAKHYKTITDFTGGLMSPHLRGRVDIDKFNKGLKQAENFIPSIQGPIRYREGFKWISEQGSGNIKLIDFSINNQNRYLIALSAGRIDIYSREGQLLFSRVDGQDDGFGNTVSIPYTDDQVNDVRWSAEVDTIVFTHPAHPPYQITANSEWDYLCLQTSAEELLQTSASEPLYANPNGVAGNTLWEVQPVEFTSHPFDKIDTSDTVLRLGNEQEAIRVESDTAGTFTKAVTASALAGGLESNPVYTEYKVGDQWGLGRVLDSTTTPQAPADPTGTVVYVDAVSKVVNVKDPSVRLVMIEGNEANAPWTIRDGVDDGEFHVRADALIFRTSHIGAWIRVGGDQLFTNVCDPVDSAAYNSQDGDVRWGRVVDYKGVEDHPVDFIYSDLNSDLYESGTVYEVYNWQPETKGILSFDGTGFSRASDLSSIAIQENKGSWRFLMGANLRVADIRQESSASDVATSTTDNGRWPTDPIVNDPNDPLDDIPISYPDMIIADMSTQRQFDVVEVEDVLQENKGGYPKLISPPVEATLSVYDLVTDPDGLAFHSGTVSSSKPLFDADRDDGRYLLAAILDDWLLMKIKATGTTDKQASVDILSSVPLSDLTGDISNNGVFTRFRMGAWYKGNYPSCVSYYEQRRVFAGTDRHPNMVWLSDLNDVGDFRTVEEDGKVLDTSGITYQLGTSSTIIRWLASGPTLICGTEANEWQLRPNEFSAAITPSNIRITQETSVGSSVQGVRIGAAVFFPHISGKQLHEFKFDFQTQQFVVSTVTKLVPDLFEIDKIKAMAFQYHPNSSFWLVTEGGQLFSLTYRKEDDYYAWAIHSSPKGKFKDVVVLPKGDSTVFEDQLWVIVERDGVNHLERLALQYAEDPSDSYRSNASFLDSYVRIPETGTLSTPTVTFEVPSRIIKDGKVRVVVDGVDLGDIDVMEGLNTLPNNLVASHYILVGLPYTGKIQLNPQAFDTGTGANAYGQLKRLITFQPYLYKSMGYKIGFDENNLETIDPKGGTSLYTGFTDEHNVISSQFEIDATPIIVQDQPHPLTLVSAVIKTEM